MSESGAPDLNENLTRLHTFIGRELGLEIPGCPERALVLKFPDPTGLQVLKNCRVSGRRHFCHPTSFQGRGCENGRSTEDPAGGS